MIENSEGQMSLDSLDSTNPDNKGDVPKPEPETSPIPDEQAGQVEGNKGGPDEGEILSRFDNLKIPYQPNDYSAVSEISIAERIKTLSEIEENDPKHFLIKDERNAILSVLQHTFSNEQAPFKEQVPLLISGLKTRVDRLVKQLGVEEKSLQRAMGSDTSIGFDIQTKQENLEDTKQQLEDANRVIKFLKTLMPSSTETSS